MKLDIFYFIFILSIFNINSQNTIAIQSFETSGDTWIPLNFSTPPCSSNNDIWNYSTQLSGINPSHGSQFWGIQDLDGGCGGNNFETITLPNINISTFSNVIFSFDYNAVNFDAGEDLKYELFFDNISQGEVIVVNGVMGNSDNTNGWKTETVSIPDSVSNVSLILSAKCNKGNESAGFDNVKLLVSELSNDTCFNAIPLTIGIDNTDNILTSSNENAIDSGESPIPGCSNYNGGDVWFTALIPASGILNVETLDAGEITNTGLAVYTGVCGNLLEIDCDDKSGTGNFSLINLTGLPNMTVYIRVWEKDNDDIGKFNIVAYTPSCPYTTRWNGSSWNNGNPNSFTSAVINANYDTAIDGSFESCDCQINNNRSVNIRAGNYMTVHNDLTVNGILEVRHEGSLVNTNDEGQVSVSGTLNVHKTTAPFNQYDYSYWSSPTTNKTIGSVLSNSVANRIYAFDTSIYDELTTNGWTPVGGSTIMDPGVGYIAMGPTTGSFPQTQDIIFDGNVNNGIIQTPITLSADNSKDYEDWNLIGNPYPSGIDAELLLGTSLNRDVVGGTIYLWTHNTERNTNPGEQDYNSGDYATYTIGTGGVAATSGGERPTGIIASGQSFFIDGITNGNITFNNSMRVKDGNNQFFRTPEFKNSEDEQDKIWLNLFADNGAFNQLLVGFIEGATDAVDRSYDGIKFGGGWVSFYSIAEGKNLAIQGKKPIDNEESVPLGFSSFVDEGKMLKIGISKTEGKFINDEYEIYLKDKFLNTLHNLKEKEYEFIINEKGVFNDRFELIIKNSTVLNVEDEIVNNQLVIKNSNNHLTISTRNNSIISSLKIYDMLGKLIIKKSPNKNEFKVNAENINKGTVLLINAELDNNEVISKKVILIN